MSDRKAKLQTLLDKAEEINDYLTEEIFHKQVEGSLGNLLRAYRSLGAIIEESLVEEIEKSFCDSENLEAPRDYPQSVGDIIDETRHGGNMVGGNRK